MPSALSVYLDFLRFASALLVFAVHANYERFTGELPGLWRLAGLGNDAVMVFFVLSGFVIAYVSQSRETNATEYFSARFARLWSIAVPAIVLTIVLDLIGKELSPRVYDGWWFEDSKPILRTLANLLFINEIWFLSIRLFSNGPYWSVGYEFWYYVIFGATLFLKGRVRVFWVGLLITLVGPKILLLLPVWWFGVWAFRTRFAQQMSLSTAGVVFASSIVGYLSLRLSGAVDLLDALVKEIFGMEFTNENLKWSQYFLSSYCIGGLIALNFVSARRIFSTMPNLTIPCERAITYLAGFTFSLYLFHYPLLQFFSAVSDWLGVTQQKPTIVIAGSVAGVWLLGSWAERQKAPIRRHLASLISRICSTRTATAHE